MTDQELVELFTRKLPDMGGSLDKGITSADADRMHYIPSVSKQKYFASEMVPEESAVYNGGFLSNFGEGMRRMPYQFTGTASSVIRMGAETADVLGDDASRVQAIAPVFQVAKPFVEGAEMLGQKLFGDEKIFANKLRNFGLHLGDWTNKQLQEAEDEKPISGTVGGFAADAVSSVLTTMGMALTMGPMAPVTYFGVQSMAERFTGATDAGQSYETSLAYGVASGALTSALEKTSLNHIFGRTYSKGIGWIQRGLLRVGEGALAEGLTEIGQYLTETGLDVMSGAREIPDAMTVLRESLYAGAVGMVAGGGMVGSVAIAERSRSVNILRAAGLPTEEAVEVADKLMQEGADLILDEMGKDFNFNDAANKGYQKVVERANEERTAKDRMSEYMSRMMGEGGITKEQMQQKLDELRMNDPAAQELNRLRAEAQATAQSELDEKGVSMPGSKDAENAKAILRERESKAQPEIQVPLDERVPAFTADMTPERKLAVGGRIATLRGTVNDLRRKMTARERQVVTAEQSVAVDPKYNAMFEDLAQAQLELDTLLAYPDMVDLTGKEVTLNEKALTQMAIKRIQALAETAKKNFKAGVQMSNAEFAWVRANLNKLLMAKGLPRDRQAKLYKKYSKINTPQAFMNMLPMLQQDIEYAIADTQITVLQESIGKLVDVMRGNKERGVRSTDLDPESQKLADIFVKTYDDPDADPVAEGGRLDGSSEQAMRFLAAQLKAGKDGATSADLTGVEYAKLHDLLWSFVYQGKRAEFLRKRTDEVLKQKVAEQLVQEIKAPANQSELSKVMDKLLSMGIEWTRTFDPVMGMIFRSVGNVIGGSNGEKILNINNSYRAAETERLYFTTQLYDLGMRVFGLKDHKAVHAKLNEDMSLNSTSAKTIKLAGKEVTLPMAVAREKIMLWMRPEGQKKMADLGWTQELIDDLINHAGSRNMEYIMGQITLYQELYHTINRAYLRQFGHDLPMSEFYSPIIFEGSFDTEPFFDAVFEPGQTKADIKNQSMIKQVTGQKVELQDIPDFTKMQKYIRDATYYANMAERVDLLRHVFNDHTVKNTVEGRFGKPTMNAISRFVDVVSRNSTSDSRYRLASRANQFVTNLTQGLIAGKGTVFLKQLTSGVASMAVMPYDQYFKGLLDLPKALSDGRADALFNDPFFISRAAERTASRDMRLLQENLEYELTNRRKVNASTLEKIYDKRTEPLRNFMRNPKLTAVLFAPTQFGDMGGVMASAWPMYRYLTEVKKMSPADARIKTIEHVKSTQQSGDHTEMPAVALTSNPLTRLFTVFKQSPLQYINQAYAQLNTLGTDRFDPKAFAKMYFVYFILMKQLFAWVSNAFKLDDRDDLMADMVIGPFDSMIIVGPMLDSAVTSVIRKADEALTGEERTAKYRGGISLIDSYYNTLQSTYSALDAVLDEGVTPEEFFTLARRLAESSLPFTGAVGGAVRTAVGGVEGLYRGADGDFVENWRRYLMVAGFSEYQTRQESGTWQ